MTVGVAKSQGILSRIRGAPGSIGRRASTVVAAGLAGLVGVMPIAQALAQTARHDLAPIKPSSYVIDVPAMNKLYNRNPSVTDVRDFWRVHVKGPGIDYVTPMLMPEHNGALNILPVGVGETPKDAAGNAVPKGNREAATWCVNEGDLGVMMMQHGPEAGTSLIDLAQPVGLEQLKAGATHRGMVKCTSVTNPDGSKHFEIVTQNNPTGYEEGRLNSGNTYMPILYRVVWPKQATEEQVRHWESQAWFMMLLASSFSNFPGDYNGGAPAPTWSPQQIKNTGTMLLKILSAPDEVTRTALKNKYQAGIGTLYCAITVDTSINLVKFRFDEFWNKMTPAEQKEAKRQIELFNAKSPDSAILKLTGNPLFQKNDANAPDQAKFELPKLGMPTPAEVVSSNLSGTPSAQEAILLDPNQNIIPPMILPDLMRTYIQLITDRQARGETDESVQVGLKLLEQLKPLLFKQLGLELTDTTSEMAKGINDLLNATGQIVGHKWGSYAELQQNLDPIYKKAASGFAPMAADPAKGIKEGQGAFYPPSEALLIAKNLMPAGINFSYVGHVVSAEVTRPAK